MSRLEKKFAVLNRSRRGAEQESIFLDETGTRAGAEAVFSNKVVTSLVKFFKIKTGVYQKLESINFLKPGVPSGVEVKTLEVGAELEL